MQKWHVHSALGRGRPARLSLRSFGQRPFHSTSLNLEDSPEAHRKPDPSARSHILSQAVQTLYEKEQGTKTRTQPHRGQNPDYGLPPAGLRMPKVPKGSTKSAPQSPQSTQPPDRTLDLRSQTATSGPGLSMRPLIRKQVNADKSESRQPWQQSRQQPSQPTHPPRRATGPQSGRTQSTRQRTTRGPQRRPRRQGTAPTTAPFRGPVQTDAQKAYAASKLAAANALRTYRPAPVTVASLRTLGPAVPTDTPTGAVEAVEQRMRAVARQNHVPDATRERDLALRLLAGGFVHFRGGEGKEGEGESESAGVLARAREIAVARAERAAHEKGESKSGVAEKVRVEFETLGEHQRNAFVRDLLAGRYTGFVDEGGRVGGPLKEAVRMARMNGTYREGDVESLKRKLAQLLPAGRGVGKVKTAARR